MALGPPLRRSQRLLPREGPGASPPATQKPKVPGFGREKARSGNPVPPRENVSRSLFVSDRFKALHLRPGGVPNEAPSWGRAQGGSSASQKSNSKSPEASGGGNSPVLEVNRSLRGSGTFLSGGRRATKKARRAQRRLTPARAPPRPRGGRARRGCAARPQVGGCRGIRCMNVMPRAGGLPRPVVCRDYVLMSEFPVKIVVRSPPPPPPPPRAPPAPHGCPQPPGGPT